MEISSQFALSFSSGLRFTMAFRIALLALATVVSVISTSQSAAGHNHQKRQAAYILLNPDETLCHPEPTADKPQYIIGYGTLIDEESKNKFYTEAGESIPVRVGGFGRHWNFQKPAIGFGATYIGVALDAGATFNGVAFTVPSGDNVTTTMEEHDKRQPSFCRQRIQLKSVMPLVEGTTLDEGDYWIYVTRSELSNLPNPTYPIVQSYVDTFIIGCLDMGKKHELKTYAEECVLSTLGWESSWVNDRIYPRRPTIKQPRAEEIDKLLASKAPLGFSRIQIEG